MRPLLLLALFTLLFGTILAQSDTTVFTIPTVPCSGDACTATTQVTISIPTVPCVGADCQTTTSGGTPSIPTVPCSGSACETTSTISSSTASPSTVTESSTVTETTTTSSTTRTTTTEKPPPANLNRTVVFVFDRSYVGEDFFIKGGVDPKRRPDCSNDAATSTCAISIQTRSLGNNDPYIKYDAWRVGDDKLDWFGPQQGQGTYEGKSAAGTPMGRTTNVVGDPEYQELNTFGDNYWMVDFYMDCGQNEDGWFEFKASSNGGLTWEADITQDAVCSGTAAGSKPYTFGNHMGRCGYVNIFILGSPKCTIDFF